MSQHRLEPYKILIDFLSQVLGPDYEIVLQDLSPDVNGIIAIKNGHISGRQIGSPLTDAALHMLSSKVYRDNDFLCNYKGIAKNGHILRSSTMFLKDVSGKPIGLLCINFDDSRYEELKDRLTNLIHPGDFPEYMPDFSASIPPCASPAPQKTASITENFSMDIPALMQNMFQEAAADYTAPANRLNQEERKEIVGKLNEQGLFQFKGAISFVARRFACSTATIYRYLSEITN